MVIKEIDNIWNGQDVYIIGGGASLIDAFEIPEEVVSIVRSGAASPNFYSPYLSYFWNKNVIGVNVAYQLGDWVDICFFGDAGFYTISERKLENYKGRLVTCHRKFGTRQYADKLHYIKQENKKGISPNTSTIYWNNCSGMTAIGLAVKTGAKNIFLVAFDEQLDEEGNEHWHNEYINANKGNHRSEKRKAPFDFYRSTYPAILRDLNCRGISLYHLTGKTALNALECTFPATNEN